jgi:dephospho-CoA kinase
MIREQLSDHGRVAIDGLYSTAELSFLRGEFGSRLATVAIHSPHWLRAQRLGSREFRPLTASEMDERDLFEIANLDKAPPIALADFHVVNDGSMEELAERIYTTIERKPFS